MASININKLIAAARKANRKASKMYDDDMTVVRVYTDGTIGEGEKGCYYIDEKKVLVEFNAGWGLWDAYDLEIHVREEASYII